MSGVDNERKNGEGQTTRQAHSTRAHRRATWTDAADSSRRSRESSARNAVRAQCDECDMSHARRKCIGRTRELTAHSPRTACLLIFARQRSWKRSARTQHTLQPQLDAINSAGQLDSIETVCVRMQLTRTHSDSCCCAVLLCACSAQDLLREPDGWLYLADGTRLSAFSFGAKRPIAGEVVFNTGMVGYPESLSDPSYRGQILVLTYPLIGNYGVPSEDERCELGLLKNFESEQVQISALIVCNYAQQHSHYTARSSLGQWLQKHNIPALFGVDTRALTKKIRTQGSMLGKIVFDGSEQAAAALPFTDPNQRNLVAEVSRKSPHTYGDPKAAIKIVAVDCGMKNNIIRYFVNECKVCLKVVPWDWNLEKEREPPGGEKPMDGLFISNGPGDPSMVAQTVEQLKKFILAGDGDNASASGSNASASDAKLIPVFGICLGNQLMGLAAGCKTYKMKFGNRGMNQVSPQRYAACGLQI